MIVDSSAVMAVFLTEADAHTYTAAMVSAARLRMSAGTVLETSIVAGPEGQGILDDFLDDTGVEIVPVDEAQVRLARDAYLRFGRGSGSPARLNFGDCFSYALAQSLGEPLLFKGDDFTHTDVTPAISR